MCMCACVCYFSFTVISIEGAVTATCAAAFELPNLINTC